MLAEKTQFLVKIFQKVPENTIFGLFFFFNFLPAQDNLAETGSFQCFGSAQKIILVDQKKSTKFSNIY